MPEAREYLRALLQNLRRVREQAGVTAEDLERQLILGPGWIGRFENGETIPGMTMLVAILDLLNANLGDLLIGLPPYVGTPAAGEIVRFIFAEQKGQDVAVTLILRKNAA